MKNQFTCVLSIFLLGLSTPVMACSSCGCTLSADWNSQGIASNPGVRFDLRYDYIDQNQLRQGNGTASAAPSADHEGEQRTINRYTTLGIDYSSDRNWGVDLQLPYVDRTHTTIAAGDATTSASATSSVGDLKIIGRYQGLANAANLGFQFGLKLPTGRHDARFAAGPQAGQPLDRSLQPGTGSTDLILGLYRFGEISHSWDWFAQGLYQTAVNEQDGYRPGNMLNVNLGLRYLDANGFIPQLQINAQTRRSDGGANADPRNTGGRLAYLSPGVTVPLSPQTQVFGFVQLPIYQHETGLQLAPRWTLSVGISMSLDNGHKTHLDTL